MAKKTGDFKLTRFILDVLMDVVIVFVLVLFIRYFLFAPFRVHGPSMCNTFNYYDDKCISGDGEFILTSRLPVHSYFSIHLASIDRGDVLVFKSPASEETEYFIKRVIGLPGETIKIANGLVYLQEEGGTFVEIEEPYLSEENKGQTFTFGNDEETYVIPENSYFVMGDNRKKSSDSRRCFQQIGCTENSSPFLEHDLIQGEVKLVIFPLSHFRWIPDIEYSI